jgi:putative 2OG-Fe(II) oxygenase
MNVATIEKNLKLKGFSKGSSQVLTSEEINELNQIILENFRKDDSDQTIFDLLGKNKRIDEIFERIINNNEIQEVLKLTCGNNFMLWRPRLRIAKNNDRALEIHQDSIGEMGVCFLVNDQPNAATFFLDSSHLLPYKGHLTKTNWISWNSIKLLNIVKHILTPASGKAGDVYYLFHRTWHARAPILKSNSITIFISFFPPEAKRVDCADQNVEFCSNVTQPTLKKLLSKDRYLENIKNLQKDSVPLIMKIDKIDMIFKGFFHFTIFISKLLILELIFFPVRFKRIIKKVI